MSDDITPLMLPLGTRVRHIESGQEGKIVARTLARPATNLRRMSYVIQVGTGPHYNEIRVRPSEIVQVDP